MAWNYAPHEIPGLHGWVQVHVNGTIIEGNEPLPPGTQSMTISYWYYPTRADIQSMSIEDLNAGLAHTPTRVAIQNVPVTATASQIRDAVNQLRAETRKNQNWGYPTAATWAGV
jgi:hypothetical protein